MPKAPAPVTTIAVSPDHSHRHRPPSHETAASSAPQCDLRHRVLTICCPFCFAHKKCARYAQDCEAWDAVAAQTGWTLEECLAHKLAFKKKDDPKVELPAWCCTPHPNECTGPARAIGMC